MSRDFNYNIMDEIKERWSPRSISDKKVKERDIWSILEAARYAPSCFNEQPWKFILAEEEKDLENMRKLLLDSNRIWADKATVLITIISKKTFDMNGKDNYWYKFDAGTAWAYLSLEAQRRGLITHAMGGFKKEEGRKLLNIPEEYDIMAVIAVGIIGNKEDLDESLKEREDPGDRKPLEEIVFQGKFHD